jgi:hypothetical protein
MRQQFSIAKRLLAACAALLVLVAVAAGADELQLVSGAPGRYTVQKGDTLWGISGKFLKDPWRWPEIWQLNREQIKNPHWIYPGDVVVLDRVDGQARLRLERGGQPQVAQAGPAGQLASQPASQPGPLPTVRLSPSIRITPLDAEAIPSIPPGDLEPFLTRPLVTGPGGLVNAAQVVAGRDEHVVRGEGDILYVAGVDSTAGDLWYIYRPGRVFVSPDDAKEVLGNEQRFIGSARIDRFADISTLRIATAREEVVVGDLLIPAPRGQLINYAPHAPVAEVNGHVIATERQSTEAGVGWLVTVDKGARDGIDVGTVLATYRVLPPVQDPRPSPDTNAWTRFLEEKKLIRATHQLNLPEERTGLVFVFLVFDRVSYAVVLRTTDPITTGNYVHKP